MFIPSAKQICKSQGARIAIALFLAAFLSHCASEKDIQSYFESRVKAIGKQHIPDRALDVFEASAEKKDGRWVVSGETTRPEAYAVLVNFADSLFGKSGYDNKIMQLPDPALGDSTRALVKVSVTQLRDEPDHAAQIVDQTIMGQTLRLLRYKSGWYLAQTDYNYVGWVDFTALHRCDSAAVARWNAESDLIVTGLYPMIYTKPEEGSTPVSDAVLNNRLKLVGMSGKWAKVALPDRREGYILNSKIARLDERMAALAKKDLRPEVISTAYRMMGVPYLWGGNSAKGNDCSGFTQTVFKANGIQLPRDSRQQALEGEEIQPDETWSNVLPGDLLFFGNGKRVTHVGISLGGKEFIHQGGKVAVNSLDPDSPVFSPYRSKSFMFVRRVL